MPKITANTETKTAISIRNAHVRWEPAGRTAAGGSGVWCFGRGAGEGTGRSGLGERQFAAGSVVLKKLGVTSPLNCRFQLPLRFIFAEVLVQQVLEELRRQRAVCFGLQRLFHLPQQR